MKRNIKYIGAFSTEEYKSREWNVEDMRNTMVYNKLGTKKQIIDYLTIIKIHEDSIGDFMELLNETKRIIKKENKEEQELKNKARKIVEKYFK